MLNNNEFFYSPNGRPWHGANTRIYREPDGTFSYECPHRGRRPVPRHLEAYMARYATERPAHAR